MQRIDSLKAKFNTAIREIVMTSPDPKNLKKEFALSAILNDIVMLITERATTKEVAKVFKKYATPETDNALKFFREICVYCNSSENPAAELIRIIDNKADKDVVAELSDNVEDIQRILTEEMIAKIEASCGREDVLRIIGDWSRSSEFMNQIIRTSTDPNDEGLNEGGLIFQIKSIDADPSDSGSDNPDSDVDDDL